MRPTTKKEKITQYDVNTHETVILQKQESMRMYSYINVFADSNI